MFRFSFIVFSHIAVQCPLYPRKRTYVWHVRCLAKLGIAKMNKALTEVFSAVKFGDCAWTVFDPVEDILAITQAAIADPVG